MAGGYLMTDFTVNPVNMGLDTPQPRHAANALDMFRTGMEDRALQDKGFLRQQVGGALASGQSPLEAAQIAFAGGDIQSGIDLQTLPMDRLTKLTDWMERAAISADTPERWEQLISTAEPIFGTEAIAPYRDFSTRSSWIDEAGKLKTQITEVGGSEPGAKQKAQVTTDEHGTVVGITPIGPEILPKQDGGTKPPSGYRWKDTAETELEPIGGGPATKLPAGSAGAMAMMDAGLNELERPLREPKPGEDPAKVPTLENQFENPLTGWGPVEKIQAQMGAGEIGRAQRAIYNTVEATLRMMTGAAAPNTEVERYANMFTPTSTDTAETAQQKLRLLRDFVKRSRAYVTQGRVATPDDVLEEIGGGAGAVRGRSSDGRAWTGTR